MEFIADATKERYFFLMRFFNPEGIVDLGCSKRIPEAERLRAAGSIWSEKAMVGSIAEQLARLLGEESPSVWIPNAAGNLGDKFLSYEFQYRGPFRGLHLSVYGSQSGVGEINTDGSAVWNKLFSENQKWLDIEANFANVKYYLILRTAWDLSGYEGDIKATKWWWGAPEFISSANSPDRMRPGAHSKIKSVWYNHFADLTTGEALFFQTGGNSPRREVFPELLPVVKALIDWFQQSNSDSVREYTL